MAKKINHIKFLKMLVCPDDVREEIVSFEEWCNLVITEKDEYLERRTFMILEFYSAFKKLYSYASYKLETGDIKNITCDFYKSEKLMRINIKYKCIEDSLLIASDLERFFSINGYSDYQDYEINCEIDDESLKATIDFYKDDWS